MEIHSRTLSQPATGCVNIDTFYRSQLQEHPASYVKILSSTLVVVNIFHPDFSLDQLGDGRDYIPAVNTRCGRQSSEQIWNKLHSFKGGGRCYNPVVNSILAAVQLVLA